jgi:hypothetical protein
MEHPIKQGAESSQVLVENSKKWPQYLAANLGKVLFIYLFTIYKITVELLYKLLLQHLAFRLHI